MEKLLWFSQNIPSHAFVLWMAIQKRFMTQDRIYQWNKDNSMKCSLCSSCMDSHDHLYGSIWNILHGRNELLEKIIGYESEVLNLDEEESGRGKRMKTTNHMELVKMAKPGDLVRGGNICLTILSWKKVGSEARDKLWDEITVKSVAGKMACSKSVYQHTMGRGGYANVKQKIVMSKEDGESKDYIQEVILIFLESNRQASDESSVLLQRRCLPVDINPIHKNADEERRNNR
ncbi:reverse transcriptase zinc-binding domain-containing protein [Tanacetum coccineum]